MSSFKLSTGLAALLFSTVACAAVPGQLESMIFKVGGILLIVVCILSVLFAVSRAYTAAQHRTDIKRANQLHKGADK